MNRIGMALLALLLSALLHQLTHTDAVIQNTLTDTQVLGGAFQQLVICQEFQTLLKGGMQELCALPLFYCQQKSAQKIHSLERERDVGAKRKTQTTPNQRASSVLGAAKGFLEGALWATRCGGWSREEQSQRTSRICLLLHPHLCCQSRPTSTAF